MPAYNMNWQVVIQKDSGTTKNSGGEPIESWTTHATVWAEKIPVRGSLATQADQTVAVREVQWIIHYDEYVNERMRILFNSEYYYITFIEEIGRAQLMRLHTEKRDNLNV